VLRLAKPVEHLQAALRASQATGPLGEQFTTVARQVAYFLYLTYDAIVWANAIKFITLSPERAQKANKTANRFWLSGITLSIINAAFKTQRITGEISRLQRAVVEEKVSSAVDREVKLRGLEAYAQLSSILPFGAFDWFITALKQRPNSNLLSMSLTSGFQPLRSDS
jgi:peroxin-11B